MQYYTASLVDGFYERVKLLSNYVTLGIEMQVPIPEAGNCAENEELPNFPEASLVLPNYWNLEGRHPAQSPLLAPGKGSLLGMNK